MQSSNDSTSQLEHAFDKFGQLGVILAIAGAIALIVVMVMRWRGLRWTWTLPSLLLIPPIFSIDKMSAFAYGSFAVVSTMIGARWHWDDVRDGADLAAGARARRGPGHGARAVAGRRSVRRRRWLTPDGLLVGRDEHGRPVRIPAHGAPHTLVVGATGSGKTVTQAWITGRMVDAGRGAIVIDPKGDRLLRDELQAAADRTGREFHQWTPDGPGVYNPFSHGTATEIADKALAGETYTEPHYLRQAQRYLGHAVRTLQGINHPVTLATLTEALDTRHLERFSRALPDDERQRVQAYLDSLSADQTRGLAGTRDRLAILAESDVAHWLCRDEPTRRTIDLIKAVEKRAVVYFALEADRRPLMAQMLAAAIVQDLITVSAHYQQQPVPTVVLIDEFSAVCPDRINGLFGRARGAGFSLLLGTQELADLRPRENPMLEDQVQGNITTLIAHRQVVPASAEKIAEIAGTRGAWITTQRIDSPFATPGDIGTRTRGREFRLHPDQIKQLPTGTAAVIVLGNTAEPVIAQILHPREPHK